MKTKTTSERGARHTLGYAGSSYTTSAKEGGHAHTTYSRKCEHGHVAVHVGNTGHQRPAEPAAHRGDPEGARPHTGATGAADPSKGARPSGPDVHEAPREHTAVATSDSRNWYRAQPLHCAAANSWATTGLIPMTSPQLLCTCSQPAGGFAQNFSRRIFLTPAYSEESRYLRRFCSASTDSGMGPPKRYRCSAMGGLLGLGGGLRQRHAWHASAARRRSCGQINPR